MRFPLGIFADEVPLTIARPVNRARRLQTLVRIRYFKVSFQEVPIPTYDTIGQIWLCNLQIMNKENLALLPRWRQRDNLFAQVVSHTMSKVGN